MLAPASLVLAVAGLVSAQSSSGLNYTTSGPLNVTASQVPLALRNTWCSSQIALCPQICQGQAKVNYCNTTDLAYGCVCDNGNKPNISAYNNTLPFYLCGEWIHNCVLGHPEDLQGQQGCLSVKCGGKNASTLGGSGGASASASGGASAGPTSAPPSKTSSGSGGSGGGSGGSAPQSSSSTAGSKGMAVATAMAFGSNYGTGLLAGGMLAAFGLAL